MTWHAPSSSNHPAALRQRWCTYLRLLLGILAVAALQPSQVAGAEDDDDAQQAADGPWISCVAWLDDETLVGTQSQSLLFRPATVVRAQVAAPAELETMGESETALWSVIPAPGGGAIASDYKGGVHLFGGADAESKDAKSFELEARWIRALQASPAQDEILAGTEDGKLLVLSIEQAKELRRVDAHAAAIFDIAISQAGDKVATAAGDGTIKIFSWPELEPQGEMKAGGNAIWSLVFVNGDRQIVSGGADRAIQLWDVASATSIITIATAPNWVTSLVALPKSQLVAAGCMDGSIVVVDYQTMHAVTRQEVAKSAIWSAALSPDGKQLALGTRKHGLALVKTQPWKKAAREAAKQAQAVRPPSPKK